MKPLTEQQAKVLAYIRRRINDGLPPTVREIVAEFNFASTNGAMCHLEALEKKGYIRRETCSARAISLGDGADSCATLWGCVPVGDLDATEMEMQATSYRLARITGLAS